MRLSESHPITPAILQQGLPGKERVMAHDAQGSIWSQQRYSYRACVFAVSCGLASCSGLLFSHPIPVLMGYRFHGFVDVLAIIYSMKYWYLALLFLSYLMSLGTPVLAY